MSAPGGDKQSKAKSKKSSSMKGTKPPKGKEAVINVEKFRGDGVSFKCKLLGISEVTGPRGDNMCIEAIKKLKHHIKQTGEHKQKIILNVTLRGIRIIDEKSKNIVFEHPVNKISFITHDTDDKKIFGYICSARCKTGHMMYAIKYDKVAGVITATLYELFQAVFKLRQDAVNQKKEQANNQSNAKANNVAVPNGQSTASPVDENIIYEEPKAMPSPVKMQSENNTSDAGHYKVPPSRPLPPAPYASSTSHDSPKTGHLDFKKNQPQTADSSATSFISESFFGASVFTQSDSASDSVSLSSVDIPRKESVSSSSSEATSFDTRSLDLKAGHSVSTPPTGRGGFTSPEGAVSHASPETGTILEEDPNYETIPSTNYETIPSIPRNETKDAAKAEFKGFSFKESCSTVEPFPRSDSLNDPTVSKNSAVQEKQLSAGAFGDDDLFKCFGDNTFDEMALANSNNNFPINDPFAPTTVTTTQESQSQAADAFSGDPFEAAFGPGQMSPVPFGPSKQPDIVDSSVGDSSGDMFQEPAMDKSCDHFEAAFGSAEISSPPFKTENIEKKEEKDLGDTEWVSTFDNGKNGIDVEDKKSEKSKESKVEFQWGFDSVDEKEPHLTSTTDVKNEVTWSTAFDDKKPHGEVSFSWDDAFGAPVDSNDGETKNYFEGVSFGDAFASTPFTKESSSKNEPFFPEDSFSNFGTVAIKPDDQEPQKSQVVDSKDEVSEKDTKEHNKESDSEETQSQDTNNKENENKPSLADDEGLSSSSDKENDSESDKVTIPKVVEPVSEDQVDDTTSEELTRPTSIPFHPTKPKQHEVTSPNAPPPLPPRFKAALPVLPPRPRTSSSPLSSQIPPTPPRPAGLSGRDSPVSKGKRLPPALPPRIDLEMEKTQTHVNPPVPLSITGFNPDAFSSPKNEGTSSSWQANWENETSKENKDKDNVTNSKTSPDPFGDDFFTDFNLSAAKDTSSKPNEATLNNQDFFADPFLAKESKNDLFVADFGGEDPFADFSSNNEGKKIDLFKSDEGSVFSQFSTIKDPFSDDNDPFAEKMSVNDDPFGSNIKKDEPESMSFHLKDSSDADFTDSFA
ncbi:uncharacterized protein LOC116307340 [Actinia tenebrosa]|uniref:Uncharacterized protein LOC116307340 n=1 Tax=Actinia tenebrosa TaxID=6105 RepID=A0A6P8J1G8_ACTTE|nr:uncharacterized protein LOC116307340 [Actinia tenebrosa]